MLKKKNITGIVTILSVVTLLLLFIIIRSQAEMVKAFYVKLALTNLALVFASAGIYLVDLLTEPKKTRMNSLTLFLGAFLVLFTFLVSFDIIHFSAGWNWALVTGILFVLLVQMQLADWGKNGSTLLLFSIWTIAICDLFLILFFIAKFESYTFSLWVNLAAILSIVFTVVALIALRKK